MGVPRMRIVADSCTEMRQASPTNTFSSGQPGYHNRVHILYRKPDFELGQGSIGREGAGMSAMLAVCPVYTHCGQPQLQFPASA